MRDCPQERQSFQPSTCRNCKWSLFNIDLMVVNPAIWPKIVLAGALGAGIAGISFENEIKG